jgi:osmotically-inducible protein OsmY
MIRNNPKTDAVYDKSVKRLRDSDRYSQIGESEYSRERSDPYEMADYLIDHDLELNRGFHGKGPKNYHKSDSKIYEEVCELLMRDPVIDARGIEVKVTHGEVILTGLVESRDIKRMAELSIEGIVGVKDIFNQLKVGRVDH